MRITKNTLKVERERWTDPGDYPSNAGGGPLPARDVVVGVSGRVTLADFSLEDIVELLTNGDQKILELVNNELTEVKVYELEYTLHQGQIQATVSISEEL